jgi:hypothetical protein
MAFLAVERIGSRGVPAGLEKGGPDSEARVQILLSYGERAGA